MILHPQESVIKKLKTSWKKKTKNNPSELSSPSCAAGATELIFKICGVAQETWVRGNVFVGCQQKPKKRKGHVTNTLHQRVGVKRSWVPSSNQTWLAGKATIYSWYKNPPLSGDDSEKLPISGSQMEKQFLRWRRLQILGSFPMFIHTYYNDTYIYMCIYICSNPKNEWKGLKQTATTPRVMKIVFSIFLGMTVIDDKSAERLKGSEPTRSAQTKKTSSSPWV